MKTMKKIYLLLIATAAFLQANAQDTIVQSAQIQNLEKLKQLATANLAELKGPNGKLAVTAAIMPAFFGDTKATFNIDKMLEIVKYLLDSGADLKQNLGETLESTRNPLDWAIALRLGNYRGTQTLDYPDRKEKSLQLIKLLLDHGANPRQQTELDIKAKLLKDRPSLLDFVKDKDLELYTLLQEKVKPGKSQNQIDDLINQIKQLTDKKEELQAELDKCLANK
jgi:hypothetical protein